MPRRLSHLELLDDLDHRLPVVEHSLALTNLRDAIGPAPAADARLLYSAEGCGCIRDDTDTETHDPELDAVANAKAA